MVCDASALVAVLLDSGSSGRWAAEALSGADLAAPSLCRFETANIIRRQESARQVSGDQAAQAHADLAQLSIEEWSHGGLAARAWALRFNLTIYDASYVALAEVLDAPLVTLDGRIGRAPGLRCSVLTPKVG